MGELNSYNLSRNWFNFSFENPDKVKPTHSAVYFFAIEHCNRLGWKEKFGFPTQMAMEAIGIKNWRTYNNALTDLVEWGFIDLIEKSKNQYSSCTIRLCKKGKGTVEALDKALSKHAQKQVNSTVVIDKQTNKEQVTSVFTFSEFWDAYDYKKDKGICEAKFEKLSEKERDKVKEFVPIYVNSTPDKKYRKLPSTFLNQKTWNDDWDEYRKNGNVKSLNEFLI